jgi:hypothetical protein
MPEP